MLGSHSFVLSAMLRGISCIQSDAQVATAQQGNSSLAAIEGLSFGTKSCTNEQQFWYTLWQLVRKSLLNKRRTGSFIFLTAII